jgi:hypothetical protein
MNFVLAACAIIVSFAAFEPASSPTPQAPGPGAKAPVTVLQSVVGGNVEAYDLQAAAAKRPVVLYFFPKAFTEG